MRESGEILKSIKDLTIQQMALMNEIMRLKRELSGRPAVSTSESIINGGFALANSIANTKTNNSTIAATTTTTITTTTTAAATTPTKKRGRGRPRKDAETVSSLTPLYATNDDLVDDRDCHNGGDSKPMLYVLEGGELFLHNIDNGRLFDIETRTVVGRYNLYLDRIDWL
jgi:hypothetical protein